MDLAGAQLFFCYARSQPFCPPVYFVSRPLSKAAFFAIGLRFSYDCRLPLHGFKRSSLSSDRLFVLAFMFELLVSRASARFFATPEYFSPSCSPHASVPVVLSHERHALLLRSSDACSWPSSGVPRCLEEYLSVFRFALW